MDRDDLTWAQVALEARIRGLEPALDVLALDENQRLRGVAATFPNLANGFAPILRAADELDGIAELGAGILRRAAPLDLGQAIETIVKLRREAPTNRHSRRVDQARAERQARRIRKSERLQGIAQAAPHETLQ